MKLLWMRAVGPVTEIYSLPGILRAACRFRVRCPYLTRPSFSIAQLVPSAPYSGLILHKFLQQTENAVKNYTSTGNPFRWFRYSSVAAIARAASRAIVGTYRRSDDASGYSEATTWRSRRAEGGG